ncbi:hypothetical protein FNX44_000105 [Streptomyces sp. OF1]|uniref:Uncharacterized protein n=1 Tax=Streptomyces alkaliterrae TaxID=2213162 RepID=A0A5P0YIU7_9ACTN|nr:hypothetical protein [Streptomyces alkaliterrae]
MERSITTHVAPALGDVRRMGEGDTVWMSPGVQERSDWGRYVDAIAGAIARGADARWCRHG